MTIRTNFFAFNALLICSACSGCIPGSSRAARDKGEQNIALSDGVESQQAGRQARVAGELQKRLLQELAASDSQEMFALFSRGGWSYPGQIAVLTKDRTQGKVLWIKMAQKDPETIKSLDGQGMKSFLEGIAVDDKVADYEKPQFDGIEYELVVAKRGTDGTPVIAKRIFMNSLQLGAPESAKYEVVVRAFEQLVK